MIAALNTLVLTAVLFGMVLGWAAARGLLWFQLRRENAARRARIAEDAETSRILSGFGDITPDTIAGRHRG